jgi:hypothetical protein
MPPLYTGVDPQPPGTTFAPWIGEAGADGEGGAGDDDAIGPPEQAARIRAANDIAIVRI